MWSNSYSNILQYFTYLFNWCWNITKNRPVVFWDAYFVNRNISHVYYYQSCTPNCNIRNIDISHLHVPMDIMKARFWPWTKAVTVRTVFSKNWTISHWSRRRNVCQYFWRSMQYNETKTVNSRGLPVLRTTNVLRIRMNRQREGSIGTV